MSESSSGNTKAHDPAFVAAGDARYRLLVETVRDYAIFMLDPTGHVLTWNEGARLIKGWTKEEIVGSHFSRFYKQEEVDRGWPDYELARAAADGRFEDESWRVRKDGSQFWANVVITALRDEKGELVGFSKVTRDLTERRHQEEELRQSEERFRMLVEGVDEYAIFLLDPDGRVMTWNAGARRIKGYEADEIVGSHFSRFYPTEAIERGWPAHELQTATLQGRFEDEGWRIRKDGSRFWANVVITALRDRAGGLIGFSKITRDLSDRRRHEQALAESEERFRLLVEGLEDYAIIMLNPDGFVNSWNSGAARIMGYDSDEIHGKHFSHFYSTRDVADGKPWALLNVARESRRAADEGWRIRKDFSQFWAADTITALYDAEGKLYGFALVMQNLTQKRQSDAQAIVAQRMKDCIAVVAHELRNPLAPIRNAVELLGKKGLSDRAREAMRQTIDRQSYHLMKVVDDLVDINRIAHGKFTVRKAHLDLREVLAQAIETSRPLIDAQGHALQVAVPDDALPFHGDAFRLTQVVANLLNNAAKYTPRGGQISLAAAPSGPHLEIRVRDTGRGLQRKDFEKIFEPFAQTDAAADQGGLGVGLALVRKVVELHDGTVEPQSEGPGKGSEFIVRLPLPIRSEARDGDAEPSMHDVAASLKILLVDDNKDATASLQLLLEMMGHEVRTAYDGRAGLIAAAEFEPHVALLDIGLPVLSGYEVAKTLRTGSRRKAVLVAITGWGQEADKRKAREAGFDFHLVKPISERTLRSLLDEISVRLGIDANDG